MLIKSSFFLKHKKVVIILAVVIIVAAVGIIYITSRSKNTKTGGIIRNTALATTGDIVSSISGSGTIQSASTKTVSSEVSATVTEVNVAVGDKVSKGDIIMSLDLSDYESNLRNKQKTVTTMQKNISSLKEDISNLNIYSEYSGYVSNLKYSVGDTINKNTVLFNVTDDSKFKINFTFYYNSAVDIKEGDTASIFLTNTFAYVYGTVSYVSDLKEGDASGGQTQTVEIEVNNPGYTLYGVNAIATVNTATKSIKAISEATFEYNQEVAVKCESSGTIKELNVKNGKYVTAGQLTVALENDDLYDDLSEAQTNLTDAYEELNDAKDDKGFYTITSPIDGVITEVYVSADDYVRAETSLLKVVNSYDIEFEIDVDELDISKVKLGQEVQVTVDALKETSTEPLIGTVTEIALEGTSMNSVTSYPIVISLKGNDLIKMGMNVSALIITNSKEDVLMVPVEAIDTKKNKNYVTLKDGTVNEVEVGEYNEDYIEIVSGLSEGDEVMLPVTVAGSSETSSKVSTSGGGMMNFGGSMSGSGMPSGIPSGGGMPNRGGM